MMQLWIQLIYSFFFTLVLELPFVVFFRARKKDLLLFVLVNILTNPAVVLLSYLTGYNFGIQILLETVAVFVEGWYYKKYAGYIRRAMCCSLCANGFSYLAGILIQLMRTC